MKRNTVEEILRLLPVSLRTAAANVLKSYPSIQEIRLRTGKPMQFLIHGQEICPAGKIILTPHLMLETMEFVSRFSMYAYEEEIRQGFLTVKGGHRVGISGKAVISQGAIRTIRNISFIHIRIAGAYPDCARKIIPYLYQNGQILSTLVFSPPGQGKTTILRDMIRQISNGNRYGDAVSVSVIDERGELAACDQGVPQMDLGKQTDVLDGCPKLLGMPLMLRSMAPQVMAVDEIGSLEEAKILELVSGCGCAILATAHGETYDALMEKTAFRRLRRNAVFRRYVKLQGDGAPGVMDGIYAEDGRRLDGCAWQES